MTKKQKAVELINMYYNCNAKNQKEAVSQAKEAAIDGIRKRIVSLDHHVIRRNEMDFDTVKTEIKQLMWWNDVVCELEEMEAGKKVR